MPKDKKASSKTARVLGLLTSPAPDQIEPESTGAASSGASKLPELPKASDDVVVEAEVRGALEQELEAAMEEAPPRRRRAVRPAPEPEAPSAPQPVQQAEPAPEFGALSESQPVYQPAPRLPDAGSKPKARPKAKPVPEDVHLPTNPTAKLAPDIYCFNITQALVEAKVDKYIKLFGLCDCPRCRVDVIALALTNLPPKYVVAKEHEMVPLLSVYEGKYNAAIVSQVMNACKLVMEHPRHDRME